MTGMALKIKSLQSLVLSTAIVSFTAGASYAVEVPSSAEPGIVIKSLEDTRRTPSKLEGSFVVEDKDIDTDSASKEKIFTLERVVLDGSTVYKQDDLNEVLSGYIGKQVSLSDLNEIATKVTRKYRDDGYVFSSAVLSPQKIKNGEVHLKAVEGRVTEVNIVGEYTDDSGIIKKMAEKIKSNDKATNTKDLERYLLLIDDLPGIKARSIIRPSKTPNGGELIINIEQDDFEGSINIDNRGSNYLGQERATAVAAFNSVFGIHDRTTFRGIVSGETEELRFGDITHEEQIGSDGMRVKGRFAITETKPGEELETFDIKGSSRLLDIEALYPVIRGRHYNVNLLGGFTGIDSKSDVLGIRTAEDSVRYFHAGTRLDFTDEFAGVNQFDLQFAKGVDTFGASEDGFGRSRANGEHDFFRTNITASRVQDIAAGFSAEASISAQYSPEALLASEEFSIGGPSYGRGYDAGEIAGDRGVAGLVELRYSDTSEYELLKSYQLYTFYDVGRVWNYSPVVGETARESLASVGAGTRFNLDYDLSGELQFSAPLTRDVAAENDSDPRVFINILKRF